MGIKKIDNDTPVGGYHQHMQYIEDITKVKIVHNVKQVKYVFVKAGS